MSQTIYVSLSNNDTILSLTPESTSNVIKTFDVTNYDEALTYIDFVLRSHPWNLKLSVYCTDSRSYYIDDDDNYLLIQYIDNLNIA